jgi:SAM-dependent methyltransferase
MRWTGRLKMGHFPLPLSEARRIRQFLLFPEQPSSALDPCVGDGGAFAAITSGAEVVRYGIELDAYRAEQARQRIAQVIHGNTMEVHCPVESFGLLYQNPPYDWTLQPSADGRSGRTEQVFLAHTHRWLKPGGVLVLVIPGERLADCGQILASHFRDVRIYRLEAPECVLYKQVAVICLRRDRREQERLQDSDIARARLQFASLARDFTRLPSLPSEPDAPYKVPPGGPVHLISRGLPLDQVEDLLPQSAAYRQAARILFAEPPANSGRPLTPLHGGHTALLAVSSMLDGIFGAGNDRHLAAWHSVKVVDKNEQEEDGTVTITERERFSNELTLIYATGEIATLK